MLHNKYYGILKLFTGDYAMEIYGRQLIGKVNLSQKGIALALAELEQKGIVKSKTKGSIKFYSLNMEYSEIRDVLALAELTKKIGFLLKNRKIANIIKEDKRIIGIFGSYAKGSQKPDSDIDMFIVGKKEKDDYDKKGRKLDLNISIKYFSEGEFKGLLHKKNSLLKEIIRNHVLLFNIEKFIQFIWRDYYGIN